jgi:hypothetical protein
MNWVLRITALVCIGGCIYGLILDTSALLEALFYLLIFVVGGALLWYELKRS